MSNLRLELLLERVAEDESLRGNLSDYAAQVLFGWITEQIHAVAGDPQRPDSEVEADVVAIRTAARAVARTGEPDPQQVLMMASRRLSRDVAQRQPQASPDPVLDQPEELLLGDVALAEPPTDAAPPTAVIAEAVPDAPQEAVPEDVALLQKLLLG